MKVWKGADRLMKVWKGGEEGGARHVHWEDSVCHSWMP